MAGATRSSRRLERLPLERQLEGLPGREQAPAADQRLALLADAVEIGVRELIGRLDAVLLVVEPDLLVEILSGPLHTARALGIEEAHDQLGGIEVGGQLAPLAEIGEIPPICHQAVEAL